MACISNWGVLEYFQIQFNEIKRSIHVDGTILAIFDILRVFYVTLPGNSIALKCLIKILMIKLSNKLSFEFDVKMAESNSGQIAWIEIHSQHTTYCLH